MAPCLTLENGPPPPPLAPHPHPHPHPPMYPPIYPHDEVYIYYRHPYAGVPVCYCKLCHTDGYPPGTDLAGIAIFPEVDKAQHSSKEEHRDAIQAFVERNGRPPHVVGRPHPSPLSSDEHLVCLNRGLRSWFGDAMERQWNGQTSRKGKNFGYKLR